MVHPTNDRVSLNPIHRVRGAVDLAILRLDVQAGATVAIFGLPQAMAYAMLAGLPPVHGLYAAMVMAIVGALWGSSPHLSSGPSNSSALLTAAALLPFLAQGNLLHVVFQLTLLVGIIRTLMGVFRLGWLVRFVSESTFTGFMVGAGLLIALGQLHHLLGTAGSREAWFVLRIAQVLGQIPTANVVAAAIGLSTLALMIALQRFSKRLPITLFVIGLATVVAHYVGDAAGIRLVRDIAPIPTGLPAVVLYPIDLPLMVELAPAAFAIAAIGLIEAVSMGQILALKHRLTLNFNQEFFGQGMTHLFGAVLQGFPGSTSFSRSVLIEQSGGRTRWANIFSGIFMAVALLTIPGWLELIPVAALAGLLLYIGYKLIDIPKIRRVWATSRADAAVLALTFFVTVFIKIEYGFFVGIIASMALFLSNARSLKLYEMVPRAERQFEERPYLPGSRHDPSDVVAVSLHGDLFFGVAHELRDQLNEINRLQAPKHLIIRTRRAYSIDYSCWSAIADFADAFAERGGQIYLSGVRAEYCDVIARTRLADAIPQDCIFVSEDAPFDAFEQVIAAVVQRLPADAVLSTEWDAHVRRMRSGQSESDIAGTEPVSV